jgi:four helix bundle protein
MTKYKLNILNECKDIMKEIFKVIKDNPQYRYDINQQLLRSGLSIGSNIAEGNERIGHDRNHLFNIALGSLEECYFQLSCYDNYDISSDLQDKFDKIRATVRRLKAYSTSTSISPSPS